MIVQDSYTYVQIGLAVRLLRNLQSTATKEFTVSALSMLSTLLEKGNFPVTLAAIESTSYEKMESKLQSLPTPDSAVGAEIAELVHDEAMRIETVVFPEAAIKKIYILPNRRFNSEYLLNSPKSLLRAGAFEKLDLIAQTDITSACRCILFGEATASAFHILRATESVLKRYYLFHRRQKRLAKPMWGPMVDQLKAKTKNKPPQTLLSALDLIRTAYRNPTQHPEAIYDIDGAQDLFGVCLDAIGKMASELAPVP